MTPALRRSTASRSLAAVLFAVGLSLAGTQGALAHGKETHAGAAAGETTGLPANATAAQPTPPAGPLPFDVGGPFALTDHNGRPVTNIDFEGRPAVLIFGYAKCKNMCPLSLQRLAVALDALGPDGKDLQALFVTVNPEEETPAVLREALKAVNPRILGLTGTKGQIATALESYGIKSETIGNDFEGDPVISHGSYFYVIGSDGAVKTFLPPIFAGEALAEKIRPYLLAEAGS